jgi:hypothetical protein
MGAMPIRDDLRPRSVHEAQWRQEACLKPAVDCGSITDVIEQQRIVARCFSGEPGGMLPPGAPANGIYWFNKFYLAVTERVLTRTTADHSEASRFVERLDIEFYGYYQQALCLTVDENPVGVAWEPLFQRRDDRKILPILFAFAGIDAHINGNLAAAIADTLRGLNAQAFPDVKSAEHRLFTALNRTLYGIAKECLTKYFTGGAPGWAHRFFPRYTSGVGDQYIAVHRALAWTHASLLWQQQQQGCSGDYLKRGFAETAAALNTWVLDDLGRRRFWLLYELRNEAYNLARRLDRRLQRGLR